MLALQAAKPHRQRHAHWDRGANVVCCRWVSRAVWRIAGPPMGSPLPMEPYAFPRYVDTKPSAASVLASPNAKAVALLRHVNNTLQDMRGASRAAIECFNAMPHPCTGGRCVWSSVSWDHFAGRRWVRRTLPPPMAARRLDPARCSRRCSLSSAAGPTACRATGWSAGPRQTPPQMSAATRLQQHEASKVSVFVGF